MTGLSRSFVEWRMLARAVTIMTIAVVMLRTAPYERCRHFTLGLARLRRRPITPAPQLLVRAVNSASRIVPGGKNCLVRAVTGRAMLARYGLESQLIVGVAKDPTGAFASHAWLERDGEAILGAPGMTGFSRLPGLDL
jgi:hypothetical protein